jgi:ABC-type polysaccharide/polyol phosphate transport system ATPase subunit
MPRSSTVPLACCLAYSAAFKAVCEVPIVNEVFAVGNASFRQRCGERYRELAAQAYLKLLAPQPQPADKAAG